MPLDKGAKVPAQDRHHGHRGTAPDKMEPHCGQLDRVLTTMVQLFGKRCLFAQRPDQCIDNWTIRRDHAPRCRIRLLGKRQRTSAAVMVGAKHDH